MRPAFVLGLAALVTAAVLTATAPTTGAAPTTAVRHACPPSRGTLATCFAEYRAITSGAAATAGSASHPTGLSPADIRSAYALPSGGGAGTTVAIVDAQNDPKAESDLAVYRAHFGLPACTTANGCFRKVNQRGKTSPLPAGDPGWGLEISLDLDAVSAACLACHILLVEGDSPYLEDLGIAVNRAVTMGATVVSNSYGADEFNGMSPYKKYYVHPGVPIVVSSGDYGFTTAQFPAVLSTTVAVGGTTLTRASTARGWKESAWYGAGSGCSAYIAKPSWQKDTHCLMRTVSDVSAVADPDTGLSVYDTYGLGSDNGYLEVGGTSLSAPLMSAMIARAGHASHYKDASRFYWPGAHLNDAVGGTNGYCGGDYLCKGLPGYDAPTGNGTPAGLGAL